MHVEKLKEIINDKGYVIFEDDSKPYTQLYTIKHQ